jgi:hypothetical protein
MLIAVAASHDEAQRPGSKKQSKARRKPGLFAWCAPGTPIA